jgi:hypothetical protein
MKISTRWSPSVWMAQREPRRVASLATPRLVPEVRTQYWRFAVIVVALTVSPADPRYVPSLARIESW